MNNIKRYIYIAIGLIAFILGCIGVVLPVLPTTPFLLLASFCFTRGSEKFNNWFINTKVYKKHMKNFVDERSMTLKQKVFILSFADFMLMFPLIKIDNIYMRITLIDIHCSFLLY